MSGMTGMSDSQEMGLGASGAAAGAALAVPTGGASLIPSAIGLGGGVLSSMMANDDAQAQQAAQAQAQQNSKQTNEQQNAIAQMSQANPYASSMMNLGQSSQQIPMAGGALSQMPKMSNYM